MKSPASATQTGLYVLGAVVGVYLVGALILHVDQQLELLLTVGLPKPVGEMISFLYGPLFRFFDSP